jgi:hypothetical protein
MSRLSFLKTPYGGNTVTLLLQFSAKNHCLGMHEKRATQKLYTTVSITIKIHRANIPKKFTGSVLGCKKIQVPQNRFLCTLSVFHRYTTSFMHKKIHSFH